MSESAGPRQLRRLLDAVMSVGTDLDLHVVLRRIVDAGQELVGARYAALGVLDPTGTHLAEFITAGMDDNEMAAIGELPKGHGILGVLITSPKPLRLPDLNEHADRFGFPSNHPPMSSFLGVPLYVHGEVFGNLYFTEKLDAEVFTDIDEELAVGLAAAAALVIQNARLHERTQELSLLADRERLGRDLHDTVIQQVIATGLTLHTTALMCHEPEVQARIVTHIDELDQVVTQLRSAIFQLHVRHTAVDSAREAILRVTAEVARALGFDPEVRMSGPIDSVVSSDVATHLAAVIRESLSNVARHASATRVDVIVDASTSALTLQISDDGIGLPPDYTPGDGLDNIRERADGLGGHATIAAGAERGTVVSWSVPLTG